MAAKRPLRTTSFRKGKEVSHGRAASLNGAVLSAARRMFKLKISAVQITSPGGRLLSEVGWTVANKDLTVYLAKGYRRWIK